jgi:hypothetical protein
MPKIHGKRAAFYITDVGGTERNLSNFFNSLEHPTAVDTAETSGFGDNDKSFVIGLRGHNMRGSGLWSGGANEVDQVLQGLLGGGASGTVLATYKYAPQGSATGNVYYTGSCIVTNYAPSAPLNGAVTFSFDAQITGAVTRTTF